MPDILHDFPISAPASQVFEALCSPEGLAAWWTRDTEGTPGPNHRYRLGFGPGYDWGGVIRRYEPDQLVEWELTEADSDWRGTLVGFRLTARGDVTHIEFWHTGWRNANAHFRTSSFCWAMYLRLLRRYVERGEIVPYPGRLDA